MWSGFSFCFNKEVMIKGGGLKHVPCVEDEDFIQALDKMMLENLQVWMVPLPQSVFLLQNIAACSVLVDTRISTSKQTFACAAAASSRIQLALASASRIPHPNLNIFLRYTGGNVVNITLRVISSYQSLPFLSEVLSLFLRPLYLEFA